VQRVFEVFHAECLRESTDGQPNPAIGQVPKYTIPGLVAAFSRRGRTSPASAPLLASDKLVWSPEEDLRGQVPAQFTAKWTLDGDRLKRKFIPARRHIAAASLASDDEGLAA